MATTEQRDAFRATFTDQEWAVLKKVAAGQSELSREDAKIAQRIQNRNGPIDSNGHTGWTVRHPDVREALQSMSATTRAAVTMANSKTDKPDAVVRCPDCRKWVGEFGGKMEDHDRAGEPTGSYREGNCHGGGERAPSSAERMSAPVATASQMAHAIHAARAMAGTVTMSALPRLTDRGWSGGDSRTLYAFTDRLTGRTTIHNTISMPGPNCDVRLATVAEAKAADWPAGWKCADGTSS